MDQILVYSDSLTWGIIPDTRHRLSFHKRWPGVLEKSLIERGKDIRIIENCLNGRRTTWSDPFKAGRNGSIGLAQVIEMHSPLKLVILMLGSNDFQCMHNNNARLSALGTVKLIQIIRQAPIEPGMPIPQIMVIAPPAILKPKGAMALKFEGSEIRCAGLASELEAAAKEQSALFFDSNKVIEASKIDGIHLDENHHKVLGEAVAGMLSDRIAF